MKKIVFLLLMSCVFSGNKTAAEVTVPHRFKAGQMAKAAEINANFTALQEAIEQLQQTVARLQTQNDAFQQENLKLKKRIATLEVQAGRSSAAIPKENTFAPSSVLRSEPQTVSSAEAKKVFGLDDDRHLLRYIENDFEDRGDVVIDRKTELMWQKSGSNTTMPYEAAQAYIKSLNQRSFAGYSDWRLPTIPELLSLLKQRKSLNGLLIDEVFNQSQRRCWSSDAQLSGLKGWIVDFGIGRVSWYSIKVGHYVRAVRSL